MTCDIFIRTCSHDDDYHRFCLASIEKFCTGFRDTVVVKSDEPNGYLQQQVDKLHADQHTDSDITLITDSDTLFIEPVTPESFMRDGKPIWYMTPFTEELKASVPWFDVMKDFFFQEPTYEMMRRQPFMFPREVLAGFRKFCIAHHRMPIDQYILWKGKFSEYNCLGMYCWLFHREKFYWMDTTVECPPASTRQFWSHDPVSVNLEEIERILA